MADPKTPAAKEAPAKPETVKRETVERVPNVNVAPPTPDIDDDDPGINAHIVYG